MEKENKIRIVNVSMNQSVNLDVKITSPDEQKKKPEDKQNAKPGNSDIKR